MQLFNMRKRSSNLALAVALATGSAVVATAAFPAEAHAQRSKKEKKKKDEATSYTKEFIAVYQPLNDWRRKCRRRRCRCVQASNYAASCSRQFP